MPGNTGMQQAWGSTSSWDHTCGSWDTRIADEIHRDQIARFTARVSVGLPEMLGYVGIVRWADPRWTSDTVG